MKFRGLIFAAAALAILGGVLYWSQHHKPSGQGASSSAGASPPILKLDQSKITRLTLRKQGSEPIVLAREDSGNWRITAPSSLNADQDTVSSMLSTLSSLNSDRTVENQAADLMQYGLEPPEIELDIAEKDRSQKLLLGDDTPAGGDAYAMLQGDPRLFAVTSYNKTSLNKSLNDLRDKRLITLDPEKVSQVELLRGAQEIELARTKDGWQIVKPRPLRADGPAVDELVRTLANGRMEFNQPGAEKPADEFARATPVATVKLTGAPGVQTLWVRKSKDQYYAKSSTVDGSYQVDASLGRPLERGLDAFRNKKLFDFGYDEPESIELHSGARTWTFRQSGGEWISAGKKVDSGDVASLLSKLRDLTAAGFADSGFTSPVIEATVTSDGGKRVEKVLISKSKNGYLAKREKEPSLYVVDSSAVSELTKSADAVKPLAGPSK